jgi:flagellar export protein FliJ
VKGLATLIRLGRLKLDGERKRLAALEEQAARLAAEVARFERELAAESELAAQSVDGAVAYSRYLAANIAARRDLAASIEGLQGQIATVRSSIAEAYREVKAYELVAENRRRAQRKSEMRRERIRLDEVGAAVRRRHDAYAAVSGDDRGGDVAGALVGPGVDERTAGEGDATVEAGDAAGIVEDGSDAGAVRSGESVARTDDQLEPAVDHQPVELQWPEPARLERDEEAPGGA